MNKQTVYILIGIAAIAGVGYYLYKKNQRMAITTPTAPVITNNNDDKGIVGQVQDAWDAIFGKS